MPRPRRSCEHDNPPPPAGLRRRRVPATEVRPRSPPIPAWRASNPGLQKVSQRVREARVGWRTRIRGPLRRPWPGCWRGSRARCGSSRARRCSDHQQRCRLPQERRRHRAARVPRSEHGARGPLRLAGSVSNRPVRRCRRAVPRRAMRAASVPIQHPAQPLRNPRHRGRPTPAGARCNRRFPVATVWLYAGIQDRRSPAAPTRRASRSGWQRIGRAPRGWPETASPSGHGRVARRPARKPRAGTGPAVRHL